MAIYVERMSAPTAGGGIQTFVDTNSWELVMTGVDDFYEPVAEREPLARVLKDWLADPDNVAYDGNELAQLILSEVSLDQVPKKLRSLIRKVIAKPRSETKK